MKKFLSLLTAFVVSLSLVGCSGTASTTTESSTAAAASKEATNIIAVSLPTLDNPLMVGIGDSVTAMFPDKTVKVTGANSDPNQQATQIQNYITMNADEIIVMPTDVDSLTPILADAKAAGIKVLVCGSQMADDTAYDCMATVNQYLVGSYSAYITKTWVDKTYPDAKDGSIEAAVLTSSLNQDGKDKSAGMMFITEQYLKNSKGEYTDAKGNVVDESKKVENPAYCSKLKVVTTTDAEMAAAAQTAFQNVLTSNPNVKVVLCCTGDGAGAVSQIYMDEKLSADDYAKIGVFGCGFIGSEKDYIQNSVAGTSVFRATVAFGGGDLPGEMADLAKKVLEGTADKDVWDPIALVYMDNTKTLQMTDVANTGAIAAATMNW